MRTPKKLTFPFVEGESSADHEERLQRLIGAVPDDFETEDDIISELSDERIEQFVTATQKFLEVDRGFATVEEAKEFILEVGRFFDAMKKNPGAFDASIGDSKAKKED